MEAFIGKCCIFFENPEGEGPAVGSPRSISAWMPQARGRHKLCLWQQLSAAGVVGSSWLQAMSASHLRTVGVSWAPGRLDSPVLVGSYSKCEGKSLEGPRQGGGDVACFSRSSLGQWEQSAVHLSAQDTRAHSPGISLGA